MALRLAGPTAWRAGALAALIVLGFGAIATIAVRDPQVPFLDGRGPGDWIVYPVVTSSGLRTPFPLVAVFERSFELTGAPRDAELSARGFRKLSVRVNGVEVLSTDDASSWKRFATVDLDGALRPGRNTIRAEVENGMGPPALALELRHGGGIVSSDAAWTTSMLGAAEKPARLASAPLEYDPDTPDPDDATVAGALRKSAPLLLGFALAAAGLAFAFERLERSRLTARMEAATLVGLSVLAWAALYLHNAPGLLEGIGFDAQEHLDYIALVRHGTLPLGDQGWQMYQPPLFYLVAGGLLAVTGLEVEDDGASLLLRTLTFALGLAQVLLLYIGVRIALPDTRRSWRAAWVFATFLPLHLYLFHYVSNEAMCAPLATLAGVLLLRILRRETVSVGSAAWLGAALGAAVLAKVTAILLVPLAVLALVWKSVLERHESRGTVVRTVSALCVAFVLVCGWHYGRVWAHFGSPLVGNWTPGLGIPWWQDPGYRTVEHFLRFGSVFTQPWFAGFHGVPDGLYSTLWGDGLVGGLVSARLSPWNLALMASGYVLALVPALLLAIGAVRAIARVVRSADPTMMYLIGVTFALVGALVYMILLVPTYAQAKAFYVQVVMLPLAVFVGLGADWVARRGRGVRLTCAVLLGVWAINAYAAVWTPGEGAPPFPEADLPGSVAACAEVQSDDPRVHVHCAMLHRAAGEPERAVASMREVVRIRPLDRSTHEALSRLYDEMGKRERAAYHRRIAESLAEP